MRRRTRTSCTQRTPMMAPSKTSAQPGRVASAPPCGSRDGCAPSQTRNPPARRLPAASAPVITDAPKRKVREIILRSVVGAGSRRSSAAWARGLESSFGWSAPRPRQRQRSLRGRWRACYIGPARVARSARSLAAVTGSARVADFSATSAPRPITRAATPCSATRSSPKAPSGHSARPSRSGV